MTPRINVLCAGTLLLIGTGCVGRIAVSRAARPVKAVPPPEVVTAPAVAREFRGVWVATVDNIDWPSKPGLPAAQQQAEARALLDRAAELKLNAIVFQVRPACDALYDSKFEPWSEYLTGAMGKGPEPYYDPLAFWVEEAHRRGMELHAWFNPYRAHHPSAKGPISGNHISRTRPELVRTYGKHLWMDPGDRSVQDYSLDVIRDVVRRYDLDGVHIDDYFYPYKEKDAAGNIIPFPDDPSWERYVRGGGTLNRDDWRRENVNAFIQRLYGMVKEEKRWVKFGISPFGIGRPGQPAQIKGFDQYTELYADAGKWLRKGWCDYFTPQLYWKVEQTAQSYPVLLKWWTEQNRKDRHIWPGNFTSQVISKAWPEEEVRNQIRLTRAQPGATGNVHFSAKAIRPGLAADQWASTVYARPALVPPSPWLDADRPAAPKVELQTTGSERQLAWVADGEKPWLWVVQYRTPAGWTAEVLPGMRTGAPVTIPKADVAVVSVVDRVGNESKPATVWLESK